MRLSDESSRIKQLMSTKAMPRKFLFSLSMSREQVCGKPSPL